MLLMCMKHDVYSILSLLWRLFNLTVKNIEKQSKTTNHRRPKVCRWYNASKDESTCNLYVSGQPIPLYSRMWCFDCRKKKL